MNRKVLIVYASVGAGHFKAAEAVYNYLRESCPQIKIELIDALEKTNDLFRFSYKFGYSFLIRHLPFLWQGIFWLTNFRGLGIFIKAAAGIFNRLNTEEFSKFLIQDNPDVIISAHFLPSEISANLKEAKKIKSRLITIITDFTAHSFWLTKGTDVYVVGSGFTKEELLHRGIRESLIKDIGIPVDARFLKSYGRDSLREKLGIAKDRFTALVVTGSFGIGPIEKIADLLYKDVQLLVVCAGNKKLFNRLKRRNYPGVHTFSFIDNMQELMAVSDIIITKPGGLSISEALSMELVPVFISAIAGQETGNARVLKKYGIDLNPKHIRDIKNIIMDFRDNPGKLEALKNNIRNIRRPDALKEICDVVCQGGSGAGG